VSLTAAAVLAVLTASGVWVFHAALQTPKVRALKPGGKKNLLAVVRKRNTADGKTKALSLSIPLTPKRIAVGVLLGAAVGWWTRWPALGFMYFAAFAAMPFLSVKNSQRQKNIVKAETVEKLSDSIISLVSSGRKVEQATQLALQTPTLEFQAAAEAVSRRMAVSFSGGLDELRKRLRHSLGDMLALTLHFIATSEATGRPAEALKGVSRAASDNMQMEKRIMVEQGKGYTGARISLWSSLLIILFQAMIARDSYAAYDGMQGQVFLLGIGIIMAFGAWLTMMIARGRSLLRVSFPLDRV